MNNVCQSQVKAIGKSCTLCGISRQTASLVGAQGKQKACLEGRGSSEIFYRSAWHYPEPRVLPVDPVLPVIPVPPA